MPPELEDNARRAVPAPDRRSRTPVVLLTGSSPTDFPEEHYERTWTNRFTVDDLDDIGRRGLDCRLGLGYDSTTAPPYQISSLTTPGRDR